MTSKASARAPISSHPLFAAGIAVWFAALFGMGSMALRAEVLESAVRWLHLDLFVPAAAPPLGFTARLLVALLFTLVGALTGFLLARIVASSAVRTRRMAVPPGQAARKPARRAAAAPTPAIGDDNDDLARLDAAREAVPARRRGLGAGLTGPDIDPFTTPLPPVVPAPSILNLGELDSVEPLILPLGPLAPMRTLDNPQVADWHVDEPGLDTGSFNGGPDAAPHVQAVPLAARLAEPDAQLPAQGPDEAPVVATPCAVDIPIAQPTAVQSAESVGKPSRRLVPRAGTAAQVLREAPLEALGVVELVERFALALAERRERDVEVGAPAHADAQLPGEAPVTADTGAEPAAMPVVAMAPDTALHDAPAAMQAPAAAPSPGPAPVATLLRLAKAAPAVATMAPFSDPNPPKPSAGRPFDMPAMLRSPLPGGQVEWFSDDSEHEHTLASLLPPRLADDKPDEDIGAHQGIGEEPDEDSAVAGADESDERASPTARDPFSSLLDMKPSVRSPSAEPAPAPVRMQAEPAEPDEAISEDALRGALAALQQMSGAA